MFTPLIVSALTLATSIHGTSDMRPVAHRLRDSTYILAAATGLLGTGFHIYNVGRKDGGFSWQNLFYGAPLGAPMAILLSGLVGFCFRLVRLGVGFCQLPVTLPPVGAALLASAAAGGPGRDHRLTRGWMRLLAAMGFGGVGFHAYGVSRNMGGWRNWSQNILNGPPIPAPPSFAGLALAGLAALGLMKDHPDA